MDPSQELLEVSRGDLETRALLTGELRAVESLEIAVPQTTQFRVQVTWIAPDGSLVEPGDPLIEFDSSQFLATVEDKRTAVTRAERELDQTVSEIQVANIRSEAAVERTRIQLAEAELDAAVPRELVSDHDFQARDLARRRATAEHEKALEDLRVTRLAGAHDIHIKSIELERARRELDRAVQAIGELTVTAPRAGIFVVAELPWEGRKVEVGDTLWVGVEVGSMPRLDDMRVLATLSDVDDGRIAAGMPVVCFLDAHPEVGVAGTITSVATAARPLNGQSQRRVFDVTIALARSNPDIMLPGMSVRVEVGVGRIEDAVLAPRAALDLLADPQRARLEGGEWRDIEVGPCSVHDCVIESGLEPGTRLERIGDLS